ncbi:MAG: ABC transporter ATP-binding protein [Clostridia bacterium]|nr:ABC transporter ATP-binding protein [Clostridia bacterium]
MSKRIIEGKSLVKSYDETLVVKNIDFWVKEKEFLTLLGPSGCGKTTTLRMIAGFEQPTSGTICFEGRDITAVPPYQRQINTVFQKYALFSHMNIFENIAFGLRIKKVPENEIKKRVERMLELVNLNGFGNRSINSLSGGQQQRIAIARALVNEPKVLLLDEPLGALDLKLRKEMQLELKNMQREVGITFIYVTHDQEEALTMSDKIIVMNDGLIQQVGSPTDIYNEPENAFVADFIGESNIFDGTMLRDYEVEFAGVKWHCVDKGFELSEAIEVVVRPEDVMIVPPAEGIVTGLVESVIFKGVHYEMVVRNGDLEWMVHSTDLSSVGEMVGMRLDPEDIHIMKKVKMHA